MTLRAILIRYLIRAKYRTQACCAVAWGINDGYMSRIFNGKQPLPWWAAQDLGIEYDGH